MLRYGNLDEQPIAPSEPLAGQGRSLSEHYDKVVDYLRGQIIGKDQRITIPYDDSTRRMVYADYTASGRGLQCIEDFITHRVLPTYGNTHSIASATARQTTFYRSEAREKVRAYFNANHEDSVIFCGAGATGASNKFLEMLWKSRGFDQQGDRQDDERKFFREDRWGGCECTLCDVRLKNESVYRSHVKTVMHAEKLGKSKTTQKKRTRRRAVLVLDPVNHHSSTLPFREILSHFPIVKGGSPSVPGSHYKLSGTVDSSVDNVFETELVELPLDHTTGTADVNALKEVLKEIAHFNESTATDTTAVAVVVLSACSNVTGAMLDIPTLSTVVHSYNGIACWDLAAASSKIKVDMNPVSHPQGYIDFAFVSPHKLLGGPGTSGCEVIRPGFMRVGVHYSMTQEELDVLAGGWLSTDLGWSRVLGQDVGSIADLGMRSTTACDDGIDSLIKRADTIVDNAYSAGQVPFSAVKCPLLDPQLADLVWFALPTDCKWSLDGVSSPQPMLCTDPNVPLFKGGVQGDDSPARASESVFNSSIGSMTEEERKSMMTSRISTQQEERQSKKREASTELVAPHVKLHPSGFPQVSITPVVSKKLRLLIGTAVRDFQMIGEGDKILVGLSGGKDSLTMLHLLLAMRKRSPVKFTIGAATVDPQTPEYSPEPLKRYMEALGVEYHFLSKPLIEMAKNSLDPKKPSLCSFCARMKRGMLYSCMREFGYTSLALGQHLDDLAESFVMSAFHNGTLRTMKANYFVQQGDLRVIRPLVYCREKQLAEFASENRLPVISDNCPACFAAPKERHRVKVLLSEQEFDYPRLFNSLLSTMKPLMAIKNAGKASDIAKGKISGDEKMATTKGSSSDEDTDQAAEECIMSCNIGGACPLPRKQK
ncbi:hypothetical protein FOL46_005465 [Perkinsus olseni]|uniref:C2H2-type domain-containing protein n=1 Tax=Perkinsus olseni TaxID=32597 RepID=A0A7J6LS41_PEROL|nr:hypothetical protein FOL46_005465 [Perkinsus olseni]